MVQANAIKVDGLRAIFTDAQNLLPVGVALIVATVLNGLLSAERRRGLCSFAGGMRCRAIAHSAITPCAIRASMLPRSRKFTAAAPGRSGGAEPGLVPDIQTIENDPAVRQVHRDFLLLRDYAGLCAVFIVLYGAAGLFAIPSPKVGLVYLAVLALQFVLVRQAAITTEPGWSRPFSPGDREGSAERKTDENQKAEPTEAEAGPG